MTKDVFLSGLTVIAVVIASLSFVLCRYAAKRTLLRDEVTARSSHTQPASRSGGMIFMVLAVGAAALLWHWSALPIAPLWYNLLFLSAVAAAIGFMDDVTRLSPLIKFLAQIVIASLMAWLLTPIDGLSLPLIGWIEFPDLIAFPLSIFFVVGFANAFNFMDGLNGMAAGTALVALFYLTLLAIFTGNLPLFSLAYLFAVVVYGFLPANLSSNGQASIFMGDTGSLGLGFLFAGIALAGNSGAGAAVPFYFVPVIFLPFLLDVTITLIRRIARGQPFYQAHKMHLYQRLHQAGFSHRRVSALYAMLALMCGVGAMGLLYSSPEMMWLIPVLCAGALIVLGFFIERKLGLPDQPA